MSLTILASYFRAVLSSCNFVLTTVRFLCFLGTALDGVRLRGTEAMENLNITAASVRKIYMYM